MKVNNLTVISDINKLTSLVLSNNNTKSIFLKILNGRLGIQEYIVNRARKDKSSLLRNAKIRLSNIHPGRLLMNMRGQNKWIK